MPGYESRIITRLLNVEFIRRIAAREKDISLSSETLCMMSGDVTNIATYGKKILWTKTEVLDSAA